jgi:hypothetical protein
MGIVSCRRLGVDVEVVINIIKKSRRRIELQEARYLHSIYTLQARECQHHIAPPSLSIHPFALHSIIYSLLPLFYSNPFKMRLSGPAIAKWVLLACTATSTRAAVEADPEMRSIQVSIFGCILLKKKADKNDSYEHIAYHQYVKLHGRGRHDIQDLVACESA